MSLWTISCGTPHAQPQVLVMRGVPDLRGNPETQAYFRNLLAALALVNAGDEH
jgi:hypothetical protein